MQVLSMYYMSVHQENHLEHMCLHADKNKITLFKIVSQSVFEKKRIIQSSNILNGEMCA